MEFEKEPEVSSEHLQNQPGKCQNAKLQSDEGILDFFLNVSKEDYARNSVVVQQLTEDVVDDMPYLTKKIINGPINDSNAIDYYFSSGMFLGYLLYLMLFALGSCAVLALLQQFISIDFFEIVFGYLMMGAAYITAGMPLIGYLKTLKFKANKRFNVNFNDFSSSGNSSTLYLFSVLLNNETYDNANDKDSKLKMMRSVLTCIKNKDESKLKVLYKDLLVNNVSSLINKSSIDKKKKVNEIFNNLSVEEINTAQEKLLLSALSGNSLNLSFKGTANNESFDRVAFLTQNEKSVNKSFLSILDNLDLKKRKESTNKFSKLFGIKKNTSMANVENISAAFLALGMVFAIVFLAVLGKFSFILIFLFALMSVLFSVLSKKFWNLKNSFGFKMLRNLSSNKKEKSSVDDVIKDLMIVGLVLKMPSYAGVSLSDKEKFFINAKETLSSGDSNLAEVLQSLDDKFILQRKFDVSDEELEGSKNIALNVEDELIEDLKRNFLFKS